MFVCLFVEGPPPPPPIFWGPNPQLDVFKANALLAPALDPQPSPRAGLEPGPAGSALRWRPHFLGADVSNGQQTEIKRKPPGNHGETTGKPKGSQREAKHSGEDPICISKLLTLNGHGQSIQLLRGCQLRRGPWSQLQICGSRHQNPSDSTSASGVEFAQ